LFSPYFSPSSTFSPTLAADSFNPETFFANHTPPPLSFFISIRKSFSSELIADFPLYAIRESGLLLISSPFFHCCSPMSFSLSSLLSSWRQWRSLTTGGREHPLEFVSLFLNLPSLPPFFFLRWESARGSDPLPFLQSRLMIIYSVLLFSRIKPPLFPPPFPF